jgi:hypothetical protein
VASGNCKEKNDDDDDDDDDTDDLHIKGNMKIKTVISSN